MLRGSSIQPVQGQIDSIAARRTNCRDGLVSGGLGEVSLVSIAAESIQFGISRIPLRTVSAVYLGELDRPVVSLPAKYLEPQEQPLRPFELVYSAKFARCFPSPLSSSRWDHNAALGAK